MLGDVLRVVPASLLWEWDAVTFPGATLGFAWAGQLTIFRNTDATRGLYQVVGNHVARGFKTSGDAQSGWEERLRPCAPQPVTLCVPACNPMYHSLQAYLHQERDFLRETLKVRPQLSILFHMAAQMDHKVTSTRGTLVSRDVCSSR